MFSVQSYTFNKLISNACNQKQLKSTRNTFLKTKSSFTPFQNGILNKILIFICLLLCIK